MFMCHENQKTTRETLIVICVTRPKNAFFRPSLSFLAETQPRLENRRGQKALFRRPHELQSNRHLFCIYLFQIDKFINTY
jgi:hypothetical protein